MALETLGHRAWLGVREGLVLGRFGWYWRLRAALAAEEGLDPAWRVALREGPATGLPESDLTYGETPLLTAWELLRELGAGPRDRMLDLGCGRGQVLHLANLAFGCQGTGLEAVGPLLERARRVGARLGLEELEWRSGDFRKEPWPDASLYFVQPTTLTQASWLALADRLQAAPQGARAVSLSVAIPGWTVLGRRVRPYSWGWCTVFTQLRP